MKKIKEKISKKNIYLIYQTISKDSLYKNSIYLMLSTGVMAVFGFFFWIINARLFTPENIGLATTLISVTAIISSFSTLGLNNALIKYLPELGIKNDKINTSFSLTAIAASVFSLIFLININIFSPKISTIIDNSLYSLLFIIFVIIASINILIESVFISFRSSKYILIKNVTLSSTKLFLPLLLVGLGSMGIFLSYGISILLAIIVSLYILNKNFEYVIKPVIQKTFINQMIKFSFGNYLAGFIGQLPVNILPILITNHIGPKESAFFYMDFMIANLLFIIPLAASQSLFAEGASESSNLAKNLIKAIKIIISLLLPAIIIIIFFGKYVLLAFGKQYSDEGLILLQIIAISSLFIATNYIGNTILNVKHRVKEIIVFNSLNALIVIVCCLIFINNGLQGIGIGWLVGQVISSVIYVSYLWYKKILR